MQIFAHRGASGDYQDNTLHSFEMAIQQGADGIELDVFEVDDELFVFHDRYLDEVDLHGLLTADATRSQLEAVRIAQEHPMPTLFQALSLIAGRCIVNVEVKQLGSMQLLANCLHKATTCWNFNPNQILISSFHHPLLAKIKAALPDFQYALLTASIPYDFSDFAKLAVNSWHVDVNVVDAAAVAEARKKGVQVRVYTVDKERDLQMLVDWQVDAVFTNYPQRSRCYLEKRA